MGFVQSCVCSILEGFFNLNASMVLHTLLCPNIHVELHVEDYRPTREFSKCRSGITARWCCAQGQKSFIRKCGKRTLREPCPVRVVPVARRKGRDPRRAGSPARSGAAEGVLWGAAGKDRASAVLPGDSPRHLQPPQLGVPVPQVWTRSQVCWRGGAAQAVTRQNRCPEFPSWPRQRRGLAQRLRSQVLCIAISVALFHIAFWHFSKFQKHFEARAFRVQWGFQYPHSLIIACIEGRAAINLFQRNENLHQIFKH